LVSLGTPIAEGGGTLEPQSLVDSSREARQANRRSGRSSESVAEAADRLRDEAWNAWVREAAQLAGAVASIADPTRDVGRDQRDA